MLIYLFIIVLFLYICFLSVCQMHVKEKQHQTTKNMLCMASWQRVKYSFMTNSNHHKQSFVQTHKPFYPKDSNIKE